MNQDVEHKMFADLPNLTKSDRKVMFWNFLPPDELNQILKLYERVTKKTLLISKTLGIEGGKLLSPDDLFDDLKVWNEFKSDYEGSLTSTEQMHLEYQELLQSDPDLEKRLSHFPDSIFSGKKCGSEFIRGVFFCYTLPALDKSNEKFSEDSGVTRWYYYDIKTHEIIEKPEEIINVIRSFPTTKRLCRIDQDQLIRSRVSIERHIKNKYLERIDAPVGIKPRLRCWMELNDG